MMNLIKMDLYRLFRSKAIKVGIIASCIVCFVSLLCSLGIVEIFKIMLDEDPEAAAGLQFLFPMVGWIGGTDFANIVFGGTGALSLFIACMISTSFVGAEQSCGYIKNIAGQLPNKGYTVISKFVVTSVVHLLILVIYTAVACISALILFPQYIASYSIGGLVAALCLRLLLYIAINAITLFLCTLTKSQSLSIVTGAIFGIGVTGLVYFAANSLLSAIKIQINVSNFTPDGVNGMIAFDNVAEIAPRALLVAAIYIAVFLTGAILLVKKRDVK